jgi:hypothetical protein
MTRKPIDTNPVLRDLLNKELGSLKDLVGGWEAALQAMEDLQKSEKLEADKLESKRKKSTNGNKTR